MLNPTVPNSYQSFWGDAGDGTRSVVACGGDFVYIMNLFINKYHELK